jgi:UDP-N-acetylglucosamine 2-epimerase (non-hydrolysing)
VTGNTVIDALHLAMARVRRETPVVPGLDDAVLAGDRPLVLITGHRRENFGAGFESVCRAVARLADTFDDHVFVYPVHLNPHVQEPVNRLLGGLDNIRLIEPAPYLPFVRLLDRSRLVLTDSGGVQEEAPGLGKPVLVTRDVTERPEAVTAGTVKLVGTNEALIVAEATRLLTDEDAYAEMARAVNPYGDGCAAPRILDQCRRYLVGGSSL